MINGTDTAAAKVETVSPMTIMQMIHEVSVRLGQQGLEEKECSPGEWKIDFFSRQLKVYPAKRHQSARLIYYVYIYYYILCQFTNNH